MKQTTAIQGDNMDLNKTITIRVNDMEYLRFQALAKRNNSTASQTLRVAMHNYNTKTAEL